MKQIHTARFHLRRPLLAGLLTLAVAATGLAAAPARHASAAGYVDLPRHIALAAWPPRAIGPDVQVFLAATTDYALDPAQDHLQIVDEVGNVYADCTDSAQSCQVVVWTDTNATLHAMDDSDTNGGQVSPNPDVDLGESNPLEFYAQVVDTCNDNAVVAESDPVPVEFDWSAPD